MNIEKRAEASKIPLSTSVRRNIFLAILLTNCAASYAAPPDYVIGGIYPGMTSDKAKESGYTRCENSRDDVIACSSASPIKEVAGVPVKYIHAVFKKPYAAIAEVRIEFVTDKPCKKGKGPWADVKGPECSYDVASSLSKAYGDPMKSRRGSVWHKCGSYAMSLERDILRVTNDPEWENSRKQECASKVEEARTQDTSKKAAADFMNKMK